MASISELQIQLQQWLRPFRLRLVRGEIRQLENILWEDEKIESAAQGWYEGGIVLLLATDRRLLLIDHKWIDTKVEDFPYARVSTISHDSNIWMGKLVISMPGMDLEVHRINTETLQNFCKTVMGHITRSELIQPGQMGNMRVLALMLDKGLLTDKEFADRWKELVGNGSEKPFLDYNLPHEANGH